MRVLIVEDEAVVARRLLRLVREILGARLVALDHLPDFESARVRLRERPIDLLFLDLDLEGRDGFELLTEAASGDFQTVVVSARHDEALRAFEFGVADFVPKPYDRARLEQAIERTRQRATEARDRTRYLAVRKGSRSIPIALADVLYLRGAGDYSEIHCADGARHLHTKSLAALEELLPGSFERVHRSYLVPKERIVNYRAQSGSRYSLTLDNGEEIPVGRSRYRELKKRLI